MFQLFDLYCKVYQHVAPERGWKASSEKVRWQSSVPRHGGARSPVVATVWALALVSGLKPSLKPTANYDNNGR